MPIGLLEEYEISAQKVYAIIMGRRAASRGQQVPLVLRRGESNQITLTWLDQSQAEPKCKDIILHSIDFQTGAVTVYGSDNSLLTYPNLESYLDGINLSMSTVLLSGEFHGLYPNLIVAQNQFRALQQPPNFQQLTIKALSCELHESFHYDVITENQTDYFIIHKDNQPILATSETEGLQIFTQAGWRPLTPFDLTSANQDVLDALNQLHSITFMEDLEKSPVTYSQLPQQPPVSYEQSPSDIKRFSSNIATKFGPLWANCEKMSELQQNLYGVSFETYSNQQYLVVKGSSQYKICQTRDGQLFYQDRNGLDKGWQSYDSGIAPEKLSEAVTEGLSKLSQIADYTSTFGFYSQNSSNYLNFQSNGQTYILDMNEGKLTPHTDNPAAVFEAALKQLPYDQEVIKRQLEERLMSCKLVAMMKAHPGITSTTDTGIIRQASGPDYSKFVPSDQCNYQRQPYLWGIKDDSNSLGEGRFYNGNHMVTKVQVGADLFQSEGPMHNPTGFIDYVIKNGIENVVAVGRPDEFGDDKFDPYRRGANKFINYFGYKFDDEEYLKNRYTISQGNPTVYTPKLPLNTQPEYSIFKHADGSTVFRCGTHTVTRKDDQLTFSSGNGATHTATLLHMPEVPDHQSAAYVSDEHIRTIAANLEQKALFHCSAGVGRSASVALAATLCLQAERQGGQLTMGDLYEKWYQFNEKRQSIQDECQVHGVINLVNRLYAARNPQLQLQLSDNKEPTAQAQHLVDHVRRQLVQQGSQQHKEERETKEITACLAKLLTGFKTGKNKVNTLQEYVTHSPQVEEISKLSLITKVGEAIAQSYDVQTEPKTKRANPFNSSKALSRIMTVLDNFPDFKKAALAHAKTYSSRALTMEDDAFEKAVKGISNTNQSKLKKQVQAARQEYQEQEAQTAQRTRGFDSSHG